MSGNRPNRFALVDGRLPWPTGRAPRDGVLRVRDSVRPRESDVAQEPGLGGLPLTRRRFVAVAAGSAGVVPAAKALAASAGIPFRVDHSAGRLAVWWEGAPRWVIDTALLAGTPRLDVQWDGVERLNVAVKDARWAGTPWPADLKAEALRTGGRWRLTLDQAWGGLHFEADFLDWLSGVAAAAGGRLPKGSMGFGGRDGMRVGGRTTARLWAGGRLEFDSSGSGEPIAAVVLDGRALPSDTLSFWIPAPDAPSSMERPATARTIVALHRAQRRWGMRPTLDLPGRDALDWAEEPFDRLMVEAAVDGAGLSRHVVVADRAPGPVGVTGASNREGVTAPPGPASGHVAPESGWQHASVDRAGGEMAGAWLRPGMGLVDADGAQVTLALSALRWAASWNGRQRTEVLAASFGGASVVAFDGLRLIIGAGEGARFVLEQVDGRRESIDATVALQEARAPLDGVLVDVRLPRKAAMRLNWSASDAAATRDAATGTFAATWRDVDGSPSALPAQQMEPLAVVQLPADAEIIVLRPEDLLLLGFRFVNFNLQASGTGEPRRLVRIESGRPGEVVVYMQGQHIAELVQNEDAVGNPAPADPPYVARLAGPSRLVFHVPDNVADAGLPYTLEQLLDWADFDPAPRIARLSPAQPTLSETVVEAPYRLLLAPDDASNVAWSHAAEPVEHAGRVELWHTRMARAFDRGVIGTPGGGPPPLPVWRAIWSPDYPMADPGSDGTFSLRPIDRKDIVTETFGARGTHTISVQRLFLSALGAWLDLQLSSPGGPTSLEAWTHRAATGRDTFVRVVRRGYLLPFGHAAAKIEVVERKFQESASGRRMAVLRRRIFIVVRQPEVAIERRDLPLRRIRMRTLVTPPLTIDQGLDGLADIDRAFWVRVARGGTTVDLPWAITGTDIAGEGLDFSLPMAWIDADYAAQGGNAAIAVAAYNAADASRTEAGLDGQVVTLAPRGSAPDAADTAFSAESMRFAVAVDGAGFRAAMDRARVRVEALARLIGDRRPVNLGFAKPYLDHGFGAGNAGEVFAELLEALDVGFEGSGDKAGGLVTPNLSASALSRVQGVAGGDMADLASGSFDPKKFLQAKARILGHDILAEILPASIPFGSGNTEGVPRIATRFDPARNCVVTEVHWEPPVKPFPPFTFDVGGTTGFIINAEICAPVDGKEPQLEILGQLTFFSIGLVAIEVRFLEITFTSRSGEPVKVKPLIDDVVFFGPLQFVEKLKSVLNSDSLGTGPKIEIKPSGVLAGFSIGLPSISVGVMSLENLRLSAALDLPFTGEAMRLRFALCERQSPFILTVSMLGGGGFVAISLGADGMVQMEAALEFGAQCSFSIGIAKGSVGIMAGIYFQLKGTDVELTGYLRMWGELRILGLITISAEFYLAFTYANNPSRVRGVARLTVRIEILFFEKTVELEVQREFKGGGGGGEEFLVAGARPAGLLAGEGALGVVDLMTEADWEAYCEAFA